MNVQIVLIYFLLSAIPLSVGIAETLPEPSVVQCIEDMSRLIPACLENRESPRTPVEMLETDLNVCKCIKDSPLLETLSEESPPPQENITKEKLERIKSTGDAHRTGLLADGLTYAKSSRDTEIMAMTLTGSGDKHLEAKVIETLSPNSPPDLSEVDVALSGAAEINESNADWQCVTFSEYNSLRVLPRSTAFFQSLSRPLFNPQDWNIDSLASRYDEITDPEEKASLAERILFLERNQHIKNIFKASPFGDISAASIQEKQQAVYESIRTLRPPEGSSCLTTQTCDTEALQSGRYEAFRTQFNALLVEDSLIHDITNHVSREERAAQINEILNGSQGSESDLSRYFYSLQNTNGNLARRCSESDSNVECYQSFKKHCKKIHDIDQVLKNGYNPRGADVIRRSREQNMSETSLDLRENITFDRFNDQICHQQFTNEAGESLNFFGYRQKYCTDSNSLPECESRTALLSRYLREYNQGEGDEILRNRTLLSELVNSSTFISANRETIATVNLLDETPAQLRQRFGGSYPRIGRDGRLLPPLPGARASGNSSINDSSTSFGPSSSGAVIPNSPVNSSPAFSQSPTSQTNNTRRSRAASSNNSAQSTTSPTSLAPQSSAFTPSFTGSRTPASFPLGDTRPQASSLPSESETPFPPSENTNTQSSPSGGSVSSRAMASVSNANVSVSEGASPGQIQAPRAIAAQGPASTPPRRSQNSALLDIYQGSGDLQILPLLEMKSYMLPPDVYSRVQADPQLLSRVSKVSDAVRSAGGEIVEVTLESEAGQEFKVYGKLEGDNVVFYETLFGASQRLSPSTSRSNSDFRVQVKDNTYDVFRSSPNGILMDSEIYGRLLKSQENFIKILITSENRDPLPLYIQKENGNISVSTRAPAGKD